MAVDGGKILITTELSDEELKKGIRDAQRELIRFQKEADRLTKQKLDIEARFNIKKEYLEQQLEKLDLRKEVELNAKRVNGVVAPEVEQQINEKYYRLRENAITSYNRQVDLVNIKWEKIKQALSDNQKNQEALNNSIAKGNQELNKREKGSAFNDKMNQRMNSIRDRVSDIGSRMEGIIRKVGRWAIALFGIRSMYSLITSSISTISGYNEQLGVDIAYIKFALASTLQPVVEWLVKQAFQLLSVIGSIIKLITGYDIFQYATMSNFKKSQGYLKGANKQAKELKKTLAGFDEMNILGDNTKADSGTASKITTPSMTITSDMFKTDIDFKKWVEDIVKEINHWFQTTDFKKLGKDISDFLVKAINWSTKVISGIDWEAIGRAIGTLLISIDWGAIVDAILDLITAYIIAGMKERFSFWDKIFGRKNSSWDSFVRLITGHTGFGREIGENIGTDISNGIKDGTSENLPPPFFEELADTNIAKPITTGADGVANGDKIGSDFRRGLQSAINLNKTQKIGEDTATGISKGAQAKKSLMVEPFDSVKSDVKTKFNTLPTWIRETLVPNIASAFGKMASTASSVIGDKLKGVINTIISGAETTINGAISKINKLVRGINVVGSLLHLGTLKELQTIKFPRLAMGGIVNMPSRGVPVGGAITGERGPEGVIPLTDSQQMALLGEAIGKYITINASITNTMNGRVISRELQRINNENDFAYNR